MKALKIIFPIIILLVNFNNLFAQMDCNAVQALGNITVVNNNYPVYDNTIFIPYDSSFSAIFSGNTNGGVLNYIVHYDSLVINNYSIVEFDFNGNFENDALPVCESFYISAVYGLDNNFDGTIDDLSDECTFAFTTQAIKFYFPINIYFPFIYIEDCANNETSFNYFINGGITDCLDNENCEATYIINGIDGYCANTSYQYFDPTNNDTIFNVNDFDTFYVNVIDTNLTNYDFEIYSFDIVINNCPIELTNFDANYSNNLVELKWQTASEIENDFFTIQKSIDGINFENIGTTKGNATTSRKNNYQFFDKNLQSNFIYYQLLQTDFNGLEHLVANTSVKLENLINQDFDFYLDANKIHFKSYLNKNLILEVFDIKGKLLYNANIEKGLQQFYLPQKFDGIYILNLKSNTKTLSKKVFIKG